MLALQHIYKSFKNKLVLENVSLSVASGEVIVLVGKNGSGKTTLLKTALGEVQPDSGSVALYHEAIGYVPQEAYLKGAIQDSFDNCESWKAGHALHLVGLEGAAKSQHISSLSGGQKTRLALAKVLAADPEPTILLLDEPTNNLDAEGLVWLEHFIKNFKGGVILVSHDRNFINKVASSIAELYDGKLRKYGGNYDFYKQQKEIERQAERIKYESNIEERKRLEKSIKAQSAKSQYIHKNIKHTDNDKAQRDYFQNRLTVKFGQNAKMLHSRLEQLEDVERPEASKNYKVTLGGYVPPAKLTIKVTNISKSYGSKTIAYPDFEIRGAERLHIQGKNGSGKTTLLKIVAGLLVPTAGSVELGQNMQLGYFSQDIDGLNYDVSSYENLAATTAAATIIYREAQSLGLDESDLKKKPKELSRGQQAKLSFAKLLLSQNHLLILDEPTNHLDIATREAIEAAMQRYQGAMIIASHDKYFLRQANITHTINLSTKRPKLAC